MAFFHRLKKGDSEMQTVELQAVMSVSEPRFLDRTTGNNNILNFAVQIGSQKIIDG
jgi:hypothetical protein